MQIDHIGIATNDLTAALQSYQILTGTTPAYHERIEALQVEVAFFDLGDSSIELLAPLSSRSSLSNFLQTRGPGLHHLAFRVDDIVSALQSYTAQGYELIDPMPRAGARDTLIAFVHPRSVNGVLIELVQHMQ